MRLWHEDLIPLLPRQQLLGQHRECCALRGAGWGRPHSTVNYVFDHPKEWLYCYHTKVLQEMINRGYNSDILWWIPGYRGKNVKKIPFMDMSIIDEKLGKHIYPEHNDSYLAECLDNLAGKGIYIKYDKGEHHE